jgi:hypothetical protein
MAFVKVPPLSSSAVIDVIHAPGGDVIALASVCAVLPLWRTATHRWDP